MAVASITRSNTTHITDGVTNLVSNVFILKKIALVTTGIFDLIEHTWVSLGHGLKALGSTLKHFIDLCSIVTLFKRFKDWTRPDSNGKMLWQKTWQDIVGMIGLTGYDLLTFVKFLGTTLSVVNLGAALNPVKVATAASLAVFGIFDIWLKIKTLCSNKAAITESNKKIKETEEIIKEIDNRPLPLVFSWQPRVRDFFQKKIAFFTQVAQEVTDQKEKRRALNEANRLSTISFGQDYQGAKKRFEAYIKAEKVTIYNAEISNKKAWVGIARSVALVALMALSIFATLITPTWLTLATVIGTATLTSTLDFTTSILDEFLKPATT